MLKQWKAFILAVVLLCRLLPLPSAAAAGSVLDALTAEMLTDEVACCITKDLNLPTEINGVSVSWESSNRAVITDAGLAKRERSQKREATLTATASDGGVKSFAFCVVPELTYVHYQDNFYHPQYVGADIRNSLPVWEMYYQKSMLASFLQTETVNGEVNYFLHNDMWKDQPYYTFSNARPDGRVTLEMKLKMSSSAIEDEIYDFVLYFGENEESVKLRFNFANDTLREIRFTPADGSRGSSFVPEEGLAGLNLLDRWVTLRWELDLEQKNMNVYIDDVLLNRYIPNCLLGTTKSELSQIYFRLGLLKNGLSLDLDDMVVTSTLNDNTYGSKILQEKLLSEHLTAESPFAITKNLDLSLANFSDIISQNNVSVSFTSSNPNRIEVSGTTGIVKRGEEDETVRLHARFEGADGSIKTKDFDFTVKSQKVLVHTSDSFYYPECIGEETADIPSCGWKPSSSAQDGRATIVQDGGNCVMQVLRQAEGEEQRNTYTFYNAPQKDLTLQCRLKLAKPIGVNPIYIYRLYGTYYDGEQATQNVQLAEIEMSYTDSSTSLFVLSQHGDGQGRRQVLSDAPRPNRWADFKVEADAAQQSFDVWVDGKKLNSEPLPFYARDSETADRSFCTAITSMAIYPYRTAAGCLYVDDFAAESQTGASAEAILYSEGVRIDGLETAAAGMPVSADVFLYRAAGEELPDGTMAIAAVYKNNSLYSMQEQPVSGGDNMAVRACFENLTLPENRENTKLQFYFWQVDSITPLCPPASFANRTAGTIVPQHITDSETGRSYYVMDMEGENALRGYYTMPAWHPDGKRFYFYNDAYKIFEYNTTNGAYRYIDQAYGGNLVMVSANGNLFYINQNRDIIKMDSLNNVKQTVGTLPDCFTNTVMLLQVNHDETKLSVEGYSSDLNRRVCERIPTMDLTTGEWSLNYTYGFETESYAPDHINLNPVHDNLVMFAHDGNGADGSGCSDRIWMLDTSNDRFYNVFKQKMYTSAIPGEIVSHEGWSYDGERIVISLAQARIGPGGILTIAKDGTDRRYINHDYNYLHLAESPVNDRFIISDTAYDGHTTKLVLIDSYTGQSQVLATLRQTGKDPGHTHPNFSMDGNRVIFGLYADDGKTIQVGWMDISDLVNTEVSRHVYALSDSCTTESCSGTDFYVEQTETGLYVPAGHKMHVKVQKDAVAEAEQTNVTVTLSYLDQGNDAIAFSYNVWESGTVNGLTEKTYTINRTNSGNVKTETFVLENVNLEKMKELGTDFTINGDVTGVTVLSVAVRENE